MAPGRAARPQPPAPSRQRAAVRRPVERRKFRQRARQARPATADTRQRLGRSSRHVSDADPSLRRVMGAAARRLMVRKRKLHPQPPELGGVVGPVASVRRRHCRQTIQCAAVPLRGGVTAHAARTGSRATPGAGRGAAPRADVSEALRKPFTLQPDCSARIWAGRAPSAVSATSEGARSFASASNAPQSSRRCLLRPRRRRASSLAPAPRERAPPCPR